MDKMSDSEKKKEDWMNTKWRPAMGWMYMVVCVSDFILFPILWAVIQFWETSMANDAFRQWQPITLQGAGLFHMAMGAVLGLAAWGRTQEKMAGANNGGASVPSSFSAPSTSAFVGSSSFSSPTASNFETPKSTSSFTAPSAPVGMSSSGKPMPTFTDDREL
jgi:hypothetical protein